jgi:hypothetical protein
MCFSKKKGRYTEGGILPFFCIFAYKNISFMAKIFVFTVSLDEGVSQMWHFKAENTLSIAQFILHNPETYADLLDYLPIGKKVSELTPPLLLRLIEESSIDGDSAYGFQIFDMTESDIVEAPTVVVDAVEGINPNFITSKQLKKLATVKHLYRSEDDALQALFNTPVELSESETLFIEQLQKQQQYSHSRSEMLDEKSLFNFVAPMLFLIRQSCEAIYELNGTQYNYPVKTFIKDMPIETSIDWLIYKGYEHDLEPLFVLEANWQRPASINDDRVALAKMLAVMHLFPELPALYGGYFWSASSFHFCLLQRQTDHSFVFHSDNGLTTHNQVGTIYKTLKYLLSLKPTRTNA